MENFKEVMDRCKICRIGTADQDGMMIVPMNFGYEMDGGVKLYFHTGKDGRKLRAFRENPGVCFEMDAEGSLLLNFGDGTKACDYGYTICSAMGTGEISFVEDPQEKQRALELIALRQTGRELPVPASSVTHVTVLKLTVKDVTTRRKHC